jgi:hypothetical protein
MSIRDWVVAQLRKDAWSVEAVSVHGVAVQRQVRPPAVAFCLEPDPVNPVSTSTLDAAVSELPQAGMIIVTRRIVAPDVHTRARELRVCVDTFGGFTRALRQFDDISEYVHPEEAYLRRRVAATRAVTSMSRRGHRAWELERVDGLRRLTIVTHEPYELTDDQFSEILSQYPSLTLDALVITNPAAQGFGSRVAKSAQNARVPLFTLDDFISDIRKPWI